MKVNLKTLNSIAATILFSLISVGAQADTPPSYAASDIELEGSYSSSQSDQAMATIHNSVIAIPDLGIEMILNNSSEGEVIFSSGQLADGCDNPGCSVVSEVSGQVYAVQSGEAWIPMLKIQVTREYPHPEYEGDVEGTQIETIYLNKEIANSAEIISLSCTSSTGTRAILSLDRDAKSGSWVSGELSSSISYLGEEKAPYSLEKGFSTYSINHFEPSNDSSHNLAVDMKAYFAGAASVSVTTYVDNDGHNEEELNFSCSTM